MDSSNCQTLTASPAQPGGLPFCTSFGFFKVFGEEALTRNEHFGLEWRDASSGEVIAVWGKREGGSASNVVMAGEDVLVEISGSGDQGDGLRLLRVPDALKQRLSVR